MDFSPVTRETIRRTADARINVEMCRGGSESGASMVLSQDGQKHRGHDSTGVACSVENGENH